MEKVYLNGNYINKDQANISVMDRGFLFGDGIYEVIPCYQGKTVGLKWHLDRMNQGLSSIEIDYVADLQYWKGVIEQLLAQFEQSSIGIYIHVSRGADNKRHHAYPVGIKPTVLAYAFMINDPQPLDREQTKTYRVITQEDKRWQRCNIKSTALLGNVMHFQQGHSAGVDEVILFNKDKILTEASACNVFLVKDNIVLTPKLDHQLLPGITRKIILASMQTYGEFHVQERDISLEELNTADEVWLSSSSKEIGPVVEVDGRPVGNGNVGPMWLKAQTAYNQFKFEC